MATTFSFSIKSNDVSPVESGMQLVIKSVFLQIDAQSDDGFFSKFGCKFDLPSPDPVTYTQFFYVSEPMMIKWVQDTHTDVIASILESLDAEISQSRLKNTIIDYPLPFA